MKRQKRASAGYLLLSALSAVLAQLAIELGAGNVPVPAGYSWVLPLLSAGVVALTAGLPQLRGGGGDGA